MATIVIAYASMSGNTEEMADLIKEDLEQAGHTVTLEEIDVLEAHTLTDYDGILIGSYTWNDGDLPYEAEEFYEDLAEVDLTNKRAAVFGSGDTAYPLYCEAVHTFEKQLTQCGATIVQEGLKIEMAPTTDEDYDNIASFSKQFATFFNHIQARS
ncbi:flavodoxin [Pontibacillus litoralis]|uniref:Flavodoxin n=1 Tax=Pontibacillus litoralis JSM 072002 TaxID=1385512 RepID=A0A0A5FVZ8_9BACI|nr:flavodoxin [Pontibacillus litoralis]KGX84966.1 flavodoxin [Pontibacillus litoralis JSM 072002]